MAENPGDLFDRNAFPLRPNQLTDSPTPSSKRVPKLAEANRLQSCLVRRPVEDFSDVAVRRSRAPPLKSLRRSKGLMI